MNKLTKIVCLLALLASPFAYGVLVDVDGANEANRVADPTVKRRGTDDGRVHVMIDTYTPSAQAVTGQTNIDMMILPKGAKIIETILISPQLGSGAGNGALSVGLRANGVDDEDSQKLLNAIEAGSADVNALMSDDAALAGHNCLLPADTQVFIDVDETTDDALNKVIKLMVYYSK